MTAKESRGKTSATSDPVGGSSLDVASVYRIQKPMTAVTNDPTTFALCARNEQQDDPNRMSDPLRTELIHKIAEALNNTTPGIVERDEIVRMTDAVIEMIWPIYCNTLSAAIGAKDREYHGAMWALRRGIADQLDSFAETTYGKQQTRGWRSGMHDAAHMLRSQASGQ